MIAHKLCYNIITLIGDSIMYIKRKIDEYLEKWKNNTDRLPLIIKGARQTGKTESILHFAKKTIKM